MDLMRSLVEDLAAAFPDGDEEIYFLGIGEKSGEVLGAYCKWATNRKDKPKSKDDILEEMAQLVGRVFLAAHKLEFTSSDVLIEVQSWLYNKRNQVTGGNG